MTQTFTESGISTTYHSKGQESPVRVQPFYVIRNNEVLWPETYQRFTLSCFLIEIDCLLHEFTYLQFFSSLVSALLVYCYFPGLKREKQV